MKLKKILLIVVSLMLVLSTLCSCSETAKTNVSGYKIPNKLIVSKSGLVAENENVELLWDYENLCISIHNKIDDSIWSTTPMMSSEESLALGDYEATGLKSFLNVTYYDSTSFKEAEISSYDGVEDIMARKVNNGILLTFYFYKQEFSIPVLFMLEEDGVSVSIELNSITENNKKIISVSLLPFFASAKNNTDSYLFIPSGSGALMYTDDTDRESRLFSEPVYGVDAASQTMYQNINKETVRMPVFGVKNENSSLFAIITNGAESANINAIAGDAKYKYSTVYPSFNLRGSASAMITDSEGNYREVKKYSAGIISGKRVTVRYFMLDSDKSDYNGMAEFYRNYLSSNKDKDVKYPNAMVTFLGGYLNKELFLGIPYYSLTTVTTLDEVQSILTDINSKNKYSVVANLKGFGASGLSYGKLADGFKISGKFTKELSLDTLNSWCNKNNSKLFFDLDLLLFDKSSKDFSVRNAALSANEVRAKYCSYEIVTHEQDTSTGAYLVGRNDLAEATEKIGEYSEKINTVGIGLSTLSNIAYSDYRDQNYYCKSNMGKDFSNIAKSIKSSKKKLFGETANAYAFDQLDYIFDTPMESSGYYAFDLEIPFYQMVLRGVRSISGTSINLATNETKAFLDTVAVGCSPAFTVCAEFKKESIGQINSALAVGVYDDISDTIKGYIKQISPLLNELGSSEIVTYTKNGDVSETVFDNGTVVYVNYGTTDAETPLGLVKSNSFIYQ